MIATSCNDVQIVSSADSRSPDGRWLATSRTEQHGGPGTAGIQTVVFLKQANDPRPPTQILLFDHDPESQVVNIGVKMKWLTPSHLDVTYIGPAALDFEVVRYSNVEISVESRSA
jgi:hypothetical protein